MGPASSVTESGLEAEIGSEPAFPRRDHFIVCGGNALAHRLAVELSRQYDVAVVAVVPPDGHVHATQITKILGEDSVVTDPALTDDVLQRAGIATARAVAFVDGDDQANIHAAMRASALSPGIRIVLRMYNQRLGEHIQQLVRNCTVLSASATAAPAFANAALQRPHSVEAGGRNVRVAIGSAVDMGQALCVVADHVDPNDPTSFDMLPDTAGAAMEWIERDVLRLVPHGGQVRAVLQFLDREPEVRVSRGSRLLWGSVDAFRFFTSAKLRVILITALLATVGAFAGIWYARPFGWAVYETTLDIAGSAVPDIYGQGSSVGGVSQRVFQVAITFSGILLIPVVTAVFMESTASRRGVRARMPSAGIRDHVVVFGLGNAGTRVATLLHGLGVPVVGIERDPTARGIAALRALDIPVLVGDGPVDEVLARACVAKARAVMALTGDDVANLETALEARAIQHGVRIVVRLFDDDFAEHVYREFGNTASRSVSYLAAPAFAAALMGREVLGTLSVYRHVLLIAEVAVTEGADLVGRPLRDVDAPGLTRVLALRRPRDAAYIWHPADHSRPLVAGDKLIIAATRAGLGGLHGLTG